MIPLAGKEEVLDGDCSMAYAQVHVQCLRHPKLLRISDAAFRLWVAGLLYCQEHLTDGAILARAIPVFGVRHGKKLVDELTAAGLWERGPDLFRVHDYLDWNQSREAVENERRAWREQKARRRRNTAAWADSRVDSGADSGADSCVDSTRTQRSAVQTLKSSVEQRTDIPRVNTPRQTGIALKWRVPFPQALWCQFTERLAGDERISRETAEGRLRHWANSVCAEWDASSLKTGGDDAFKFWRDRYADWRGPAAAGSTATGRKVPGADETARRLARIREKT